MLKLKQDMDKTKSKHFIVKNSKAETLNQKNLIKPEFYEDFEDENRMIFHNGAKLAEGTVCRHLQFFLKSTD